MEKNLKLRRKASTFWGKTVKRVTGRTDDPGQKQVASNNCEGDLWYTIHQRGCKTKLGRSQDMASRRASNCAWGHFWVTGVTTREKGEAFNWQLPRRAPGHHYLCKWYSTAATVMSRLPPLCFLPNFSFQDLFLISFSFLDPPLFFCCHPSHSYSLVVSNVYWMTTGIGNETFRMSEGRGWGWGGGKETEGQSGGKMRKCIEQRARRRKTEGWGLGGDAGFENIAGGINEMEWTSSPMATGRYEP